MNSRGKLTFKVWHSPKETHKDWFDVMEKLREGNDYRRSPKVALISYNTSQNQPLYLTELPSTKPFDRWNVRHYQEI